MEFFLLDDFWTIINEYATTDQRRWRTYEKYQNINSAIKRGYVELLKRKTKSMKEISGKSFDLALRLGRMDILRELDHLYPSSHQLKIDIDHITSLEMLRYMRTKKIFTPCIILWFNALFMVDKFFIVDYLYKHEKQFCQIRSSDIVSYEDNRTITFTTQRISLKTMDFLRKKFPEALVYNIVAVLEDTLKDKKWYQKWDILKMINKNADNSVSLSRMNVSFAKLLYKESRITEEKIWKDFPNVLEYDNLKMTKWLWKIMANSQRDDSHTEILRQACMRTATVVPNASFEWLVVQKDFHERVVGSHPLVIQMDGIHSYFGKRTHASKFIERIEFLESNNICSVNSTIKIFSYFSAIDRSDISTLVFFLKRITTIQPTWIEIITRINMSDVWASVIRYVYHVMKLVPKKIDTDTMMLCLAVMMDCLRYRNRDQYFGVKFFLCNIIKKKIPQNTLFTLLDNFKSVVEEVSDKRKRLLIDQEMIRVHKQLFPIILETVHYCNGPYKEWEIVHRLCKVIVEQNLHELIDLYGENPHFDVQKLMKWCRSNSDERDVFLDKLISKKN